MKFSKQFKKSFSYTWYLYLLAIVIPSILFPLSYSFMHRPKQYETLAIFIPCSLKSDKAEEMMFEDLKELGIRTTDITNVESNENEYEFSKKISVVAYNRSDIIVLPEDKLSKVGIETASLELTSEIKELCSVTDEKIYKYEEIEYGIELPHVTPLTKYADLKQDVNYYAFINSKSWNIGEYSSQKVHTDNTFKLMQYILGK